MLVLIATALVFATALVVCWKRPGVAFGLLLLMYAVEQFLQASSFFFVQYHQLVNLLSALLVAVALVGAYLRGELDLRQYPSVGWMMLALFLYAGTSTAWSVYRAGSIAEYTGSLPYLVVNLLLAPWLLQSRNAPRDAGWTVICVGGSIIVLIAATTDFMTRGLAVVTQGAGVGMVYGYDQTNPLSLASAAGYVALAGILMNFTGLARVWGLLRWVLVAFALIVAFKSGSRGQLLAVFIACVAFLPFSKRMRSAKGFVLVVVNAGLLLAAAVWTYENFAWVDRFRADNFVDDYLASRIGTSAILLREYWDAGFAYWLIGLGSSASFSPNIIGFYPHLVAAEVLGELGLIGFSIFVSIVVLAIRGIWRTVRLVSEDAQWRGYVCTFGAICLFEFILSFKQGSLLGSSQMFMLATGLVMWGQTVLHRTQSAQLAYQQYEYDTQMLAAQSR